MVKLTETVVKATNLPVTVKTRLGWDEKTQFIEEVAERLQDVGIKALSIHGRTRKQMYKGEADWTKIGKIKENPRIKIPKRVEEHLYKRYREHIKLIIEQFQPSNFNL